MYTVCIVPLLKKTDLHFSGGPCCGILTESRSCSALRRLIRYQTNESQLARCMRRKLHKKTVFCRNTDETFQDFWPSHTDFFWEKNGKIPKLNHWQEIQTDWKICQPHRPQAIMYMVPLSLARYTFGQAQTTLHLGRRGRQGLSYKRS